ncbi:hypothetical protein V1527DRAFT_493951 [Lipomyces starkeyi]
MSTVKRSLYYHASGLLLLGRESWCSEGCITSSSGILYAAGRRINYSGSERSRELSVVSANENLFVRVDIRNQIETSMLCTAISRSALEVVHTEVVKKVYHQEENGTIDKCSCTHQIQLSLSLEVAQIHTCWRVGVVDVPKQTLDASVLKGRARGTRRLPTSAEIVQRAEKVYGSCHKAGHNRRSCPKISDIDGTANQQPDAVDSNDLDEDIDGEEEDEFVPEFQKGYSR